uniref:Uncharacterized protein n=1 Tax=viral metagenome TaxID=1070528 RepID=A0A6C0EVG4_9ZZZZ
MFAVITHLYAMISPNCELQFLNNSNELFQISQFMNITHISLPLYLSDTEPSYVLSRLSDESNSIWQKYIS